MRNTSAPRDRLHDGQPAIPGHARDGAVFRRDIAGSNEVGVELIVALPTLKPRTRTAVVPSRVATARASLRGMSRINRNHHNAPFLGFVLSKRSDLVKRPAMNAACLR